MQIRKNNRVVDELLLRKTLETYQEKYEARKSQSDKAHRLAPSEPKTQNILLSVSFVYHLGNSFRRCSLSPAVSHANN